MPTGKDCIAWWRRKVPKSESPNVRLAAEAYLRGSDDWAPKIIQSIFRIGQYVQIQGTYSVERQPGIMLKQALLGPQSLEPLNGLSRY